MLSRAAAAAARLASSAHRSATVVFATKNGTFASPFQTRCLNVASRPSDLIGKTPLIDLNKILVAHGVDGETFSSLVLEKYI